MWVGARTGVLRNEISVVLEPARAEADRMVTHFDRQVAAVRGFRISGDARYLSRFEAARAERLDAQQQAAEPAARLGPHVTALLDDFARAAAAWDTSHERYTAAAAPAPSPSSDTATREAEYDAAIQAGAHLEERLRVEAEDRRSIIRREERRGILVAAVLALLALAAAVVVATISHRLSRYGAHVEGLYRESRGLAAELGRTVEALRRRTAEAEAELQQRQRAQQALHAEEERFRALADNIPQLVWMADSSGYIFWYNQRWYDYTGATPEEMEGWGWQGVHHPAFVEQALERLSQAIAAEEPWEDTFPLRGRNGEYRWFLSRAMPIRDEDGRVALWFGTNTDITEQREAAAERERLTTELERQRNLLKAVTDNATSALLMMDTSGRGTFWNPAAERMTGYSAEEAMGRTLHELVHHTRPDGSNFPIEECPIDRALPRGVEVEGHEDLFIRRSGEFFPVVCAAKPIVENGRPAGTVIEVRDVTEEKRAAEALRHAKEEAEAGSRAKSQFLATMSHELRTPLNAILGFTDLMDMGIPEPLPEPSRAQVKRIDESARHLLNIIEQILTFSRMEAQQEHAASEPVDLPDVVASAVRMLEPLAARKGLRMTTRLDGIPQTVISDAQKLRQILVNLLGNAVKFTQDGEVSLHARQQGNELVMEVRDTGIGIPPEHLARVFEPFWQVDQSHTRAHGGTGLGLTVSRSLAQLLGGDVHGRSEPGRGSTFEFRIPLAPGGASPGSGDQ
jgi:PAS domain S-box-containing protein